MMTNPSRAAALAVVLAAACGGSDAPAGPGQPNPKTPTATAAHAGNNQAAAVNTAVAIAPAVRVSAADNSGVAGMVVTFSVVSGGGTLAQPVDTTDADGIARVGSWTLGPAAGAQVLSARTPGLPEVTFTATATPAAGQGTLTAAANVDNQSGPPGQPLAAELAVVVRNAVNAPASGVTVTFAVTEGGGALERTSATTDAQGRASAGRWTLGPAAGVQRVTASAAGHTPVTLSATAVAGGPPGIARTVFASGLSAPWDLAFAPDGAMLFTERSRGLRVRLPDGTVRGVARPADLVVEGQSGMLGLALDPEFASNRRLYVYMASNLGGRTDNRVVRFTIDNAYTALADRADIVTGIAYGNGGAHSGGRLRVGPDGFLYVTTGDNRTGSIPQDLRSLGSKVLRVTRDGAPAPGNATPAGGDARIYAFGFRNPQGIDFRPGTGQPYLAEHGPGYHDEVTPLVAGGNGGWDPACPAGYCGYDGRTPMTDLARFPAALRPAWSTGNASHGMSGGAFLRGAAWRAWDGAFVAALLSGRRLEVLTLAADGRSATNTPLLQANGERLRTVVQGPDGALYVTTDGKGGGDEVWRLAPQ
ncbi:MAG: PQQ-dependent sugar dehydrogenase [Gemmatimonadales bacterium]|nr:PQQ-dependent sugar dehydrogenase [Gemmatimonadales bacterium]